MASGDTGAVSVAVRLAKFVGRVSARNMTVRRAIKRATQRARSRPQTIRHGPGKGCRINVAGSRLGYVLGTTETDTQEFMVQHLSRGQVFYDVGANVGFLSVVASSLVGDAGAVYSFEPSPQSAQAARVNAELNRFAQMRVIEAAASDSDGTALFSGQDQHGRVTPSAEDGVTVQAITIDSFIVDSAARPPALVKIDVEGHEEAVVRGMRRTIADHKPVVLCELHEAQPSLLTHPVARALRAASYGVRWLEPIEGSVGYWTSHLVGIPPQAPARPQGADGRGEPTGR